MTAPGGPQPQKTARRPSAIFLPGYSTGCTTTSGATRTTEPPSGHDQPPAPATTSTAVAIAAAAPPGRGADTAAGAGRVTSPPAARSPLLPRPAAAAVAAHRTPRRARGRPGYTPRAPARLSTALARRPNSLAPQEPGGDACHARSPP